MLYSHPRAHQKHFHLFFQYEHEAGWCQGKHDQLMYFAKTSPRICEMNFVTFGRQLRYTFTDNDPKSAGLGTKLTFIRV